MKLKKIIAMLTAAVMLCGVSACSTSTASSGTSSGSSGSTNNGTPISPGVLRGPDGVSSDGVASHAPEDTSRIYNIGIAKLTDHPALNLSQDGFVAALIDSGFVIGENLNLDYRDGQGEEDELNAIASDFVTNEYDLIFAIATPAAQACANATSDIPIIATAVTDFVDAGLIESNSRPNTNVSGTTDMSPVEEQLDLMLEIFPDVETVGFFYTATESNSALQVGIAREYAQSLGLETVTITINNASEIRENLLQLVEECDAIYIPTDNLLAAQMPAVASVCNPAQIPVFCAESGMVETGGFGTLAINYYDLGYQAGLMAIRVIDGASIDRMSIQKSTVFEYSFNAEAVQALDITLPNMYQSYMN